MEPTRKSSLKKTGKNRREPNVRIIVPIQIDTPSSSDSGTKQNPNYWEAANLLFPSDEDCYNPTLYKQTMNNKMKGDQMSIVDFWGAKNLK